MLYRPFCEQGTASACQRGIVEIGNKESLWTAPEQNYSIAQLNFFRASTLKLIIYGTSHQSRNCRRYSRGLETGNLYIFNHDCIEKMVINVSLTSTQKLKPLHFVTLRSTEILTSKIISSNYLIYVKKRFCFVSLRLK